jgi:hypothetical protein
MKTAGVVIDVWKLAIFKKHLDAAGYSYMEDAGPIKGTMVLRVKYEWVHALQPVVAAANEECRNIAKTKGGG